MIWPTPHAEPQMSTSPHVDSDGCVSFSVVHCIESYLLSKGIDVEFSERFLAKMSGTTTSGNTIEKVVATIIECGLVLESDWPTPTVFTWDEFYADIPQNIIDKGKSTLAKYLSFTGVDKVDLAIGILKEPLVVFTPGHARCALGENLVFDTYQQESDTTSVGPYLETMPATAYAFFALKLKNKSMTNTKLVQVQKTDGTKEVGFYLPAMSPDALKDKGMNFDVPIPTLTDGSVDWANLKYDFIIKQ